MPREQETELASIRNLVDSSAPGPASTFGAVPTSKDSLALMRAELERLRARNAVLEEAAKEREGDAQ